MPRQPAISSGLITCISALGLCTSAWAQEPAGDRQARELFKAMSDYVAAQQVISFKYDANLEIVTPDLQKLSFASSGTTIVSRPDKVRVTRRGGFVDVELAYDGKAVTVLGKNVNQFAKLPMSGPLDELIEVMRSQLGLEVPAADLLTANPDEVMMSNVTEAKDLGSGVIGGVECDHLAFRTAETDWQIWITQGSKPRPCRFSITSKMMALAPEYIVNVTEWKDQGEVAADDFSLNPAADAKEVRFEELKGLGDIPEIASQAGDAQ